MIAKQAWSALSYIYIESQSICMVFDADDPQVMMSYLRGSENFTKDAIAAAGCLTKLLKNGDTKLPSACTSKPATILDSSLGGLLAKKLIEPIVSGIMTNR